MGNKIISEEELTNLLKKSKMFDAFLQNIDYRNNRDVELLRPIAAMRNDPNVKADIFFLVKGYPDA